MVPTTHPRAGPLPQKSCPAIGSPWRIAIEPGSQCGERPFRGSLGKADVASKVSTSTGSPCCTRLKGSSRQSKAIYAPCFAEYLCMCPYLWKLLIPTTQLFSLSRASIRRSHTAAPKLWNTWKSRDCAVSREFTLSRLVEPRAEIAGCRLVGSAESATKTSLGTMSWETCECWPGAYFHELESSSSAPSGFFWV